MTPSSEEESRDGFWFEIAQNQVSPEANLIMGDFGNSGIAQIQVFPREKLLRNSIRISKVAPIEDVYGIFVDFSSIAKS